MGIIKIRKIKIQGSFHPYGTYLILTKDDELTHGRIGEPNKFFFQHTYWNGILRASLTCKIITSPLRPLMFVLSMILPYLQHAVSNLKVWPRLISCDASRNVQKMRLIKALEPLKSFKFFFVVPLWTTWLSGAALAAL